MICPWSNRVAGWADLSFLDRMGVMPMKKRKKRNKNISLMELLTFGIFLLALLTFIFEFCK